MTPIAASTFSAPKKKGSLLPLLTVVFLASYGLMTFLIVEQGATIQAQRNLIQLLQSDSTQFWAMKGKALHEKQMADAQRQAQSSAQPSSQAPSAQEQVRPNQNPPAQAPATHTAPQRHSQSGAGKSVTPHTQLPPVPASDLGDQRRELDTL